VTHTVIIGGVGEMVTANALTEAALEEGGSLVGVVHWTALPADEPFSSNIGIEDWYATASARLTESFLIARAFGRVVRMGHPAVLVLGMTPAAWGSGTETRQNVVGAGLVGLALSTALEVARYGGRAYAISVPAGEAHAASAAQVIEFLVDHPDQLGSILQIGERRIQSYHRAPSLSFVIDEESGPQEILAALSVAAIGETASSSEAARSHVVSGHR
jgi:NAD(P)-dependent dehydrogenase (short-subunit alcohol dehydrogenase family)